MSVTDVSSDHNIDIASMLGSCKGMESAEIPDMLEEISNVIHSSGLLTEFVSLRPEEAEEWLVKKCPTASSLFNNFVTTNAHRSIKEVNQKIAR